jgi:hypothetical protein
LNGVSSSKALDVSESEKAVTDQVIRAKGYIWLSCYTDYCIVMQIAGSNLSLSKGSPWWCTVPSSKWPSSSEFKAEIVDTMHKVWGDRRQRLVVIGVNMDKVRVREAVEKCLLTEAELAEYLAVVQSVSSGDEVNVSGELLADPFQISSVADVHQSSDRSILESAE